MCWIVLHVLDFCICWIVVVAVVGFVVEVVVVVVAFVGLLDLLDCRQGNHSLLTLSALIKVDWFPADCMLDLLRCCICWIVMQ